MVHRARVWILVPVLVLAAGCRDKGAATPKQAALNLLKAVWAGDKDLFRAAVHAEDMEFAEAFFDTASALSGLFADLEETYGPEAMVLPNNWGYRRVPDPATAGDRMEVEVDGDSGSAYVSDDPATAGDDSARYQLVRKDGRWFVDMDLLVGPPIFGDVSQDLRQEILKGFAGLRRDMMRDGEAVIALCLEARKKIGREGYTVERILAEARARKATAGEPELKVWFDGELVTVSPEAKARWREALAGERTSSSPRRVRTYTVAPGDTLIGIAKRIYGPGQGHRYEQIYQANRDKLKSPHKLPIGITLRLPPA